MGSRATRRGLNLDQRETNGKNRYHKNSKIKMMFIFVILFIFMFFIIEVFISFIFTNIHKKS